MTTRPPMQCRNSDHAPIDLIDGSECPICNPNQYEPCGSCDHDGGQSCTCPPPDELEDPASEYENALYAARLPEEDDADIYARISDHDPYHKVTAEHDQLRRDGQRWAAGLGHTDGIYALQVAAELDGELNPERRAFCEGVKLGLEQGYRGLVADNGQEQP